MGWNSSRALLPLLAVLQAAAALLLAPAAGTVQPLSKIAIHRAEFALDSSAHVEASPALLGLKGDDYDWVTVNFKNPKPSSDDWIGVFSPANFSASTCTENETPKEQKPYICTAPIKYKFANSSHLNYAKYGKGSLRFRLINQRADFAFALFSGGLSNPKLVSVSEAVAFANPNAPVYPRLAQGNTWNEMTVTWTSGYDIAKAFPFVKWGRKGAHQIFTPAGTLTFKRNSLCGTIDFLESPNTSKIVSSLSE